ncbi:MAG: bacillopeptidase-like protein [Symbiobacteriaceae bacterium]|jgi:bacillopeptidase F|nr:bacillopeptidase-like protein [Symbiobacteriaceae bacterium]
MLGLLLPVQSSFAAAPTGPAGPGANPGKGKSVSASRWPDAKQESASAKIHQKVSETFAQSAKPQSYLVKLRAQADVFGAAAAARQNAAPAKQEVMARTAVINALKETANNSQRGLLAELDALMKKGSVTRVDKYWVANLIAVTSTQDVMQQIAKRSDVAQILPIGQIKLVSSVGNGVSPTAVSGQGGPVAMGEAGIMSTEWNLDKVGAPAVWSMYGIDGSGTVVASLDTGVEGTHPALQNAYRGLNADGSVDHTYSWFDAVNGQSAPYDDHGHGTHTTGTMVGDDGAGNQIGVAPGARWMAAKILNAAGNGTDQDIIEAGQWILAPGGDPSKAPDVVNNSWGGGPGIDDWFRDVVRAWRAAGIVPVFAAGNDGPGDGSVSVPGNYPESFAVGATDANDALAGFSGRGPSAYNGVMKPEISAPGVNVRSSVPGGGYEGGWNGTSMAAPHVAGTVALLRSANAALTVEEIEQILINSADPLTDSRYPTAPNNGFGHGLLNAFTAVGMVVDGVGSVSGRVVTGGDDFVAPVVTHTPVTESYKQLPIDISATASDNVAVSSVQLRFRIPGLSWWGTVDMSRTEGDHRSATYMGSIPADMTFGDSVEYYIQAMDHAGNMKSSGSATRPHSITLMSGLSLPHTQDFEGSTAGWTHGGENDVWEIGTPTSGPGAAHSGSRLAATNLSGNYPDASESFLMSPPIDLSGAGPGTSLAFWQWHALETNFDLGYVLASGDGGATWQMLDYVTGSSNGWRQKVVDLSSFAGSSSVFVAFYLSSDGSVTQAGWYIDDVELYEDAEAPAAPTNLQATADGIGGINLSWDAVTAGDLDHYSVYRSTTAGSGYSMLGQPTAAQYADGSVTAGTTYYYVVTATDMFGNESDMSVEASATPAASMVAFQDDMESGDNGWAHSGAGDSWQRGTPTSGPGSANSGSNVWATNLAGNYASSTNASLVSPPIDLSGMANAALRFAHWYALERNFDFGRVEVSADAGATWTVLASYTSPSGGSPVGWESPTIDLTPYAGQTIQIRFRLQTDSSVEYAGWYIDDVMVAGSAAGGNVFDMPLTGPEVKAEMGPKGKPATPAVKQIQMPSRTNAGKVSRVTSTVRPSGIGISSLPVEATVTVLETGRVVRTDPANGSFSIVLPAGTFTLRAEAYGYHPTDTTVIVEDGQDTAAIMVLGPMARGRITGTVTDARTGEPLAGASVGVAEDMQVAPAMTDATGHYMLEVLEGTYTLQARASGYYAANDEVTVAGGATETMDMWLEPFVGMPGEIAYDDGVAENAWGYYDAGNGWAVRMSPPDGGAVMLRSARIFLWDASWPTPGGNTFRAAVFAANPDGTPGPMIGSEVRVTNAVRGDWNEVDFSHLGLVTSDDFFIAYIQDAPYPNTPGMPVDESTPPTGRNWQMVAGAWSLFENSGNLMIRAMVDMELSAPTITSPEDGSFTNNPNLTVTGTAAAGAAVTVEMDGMAAGTATADAAGQWSTSVMLAEGAHELTAVSTPPGGGVETLPSAAVAVTLDSVAPNLAVTAPAQNAAQRNRIIQVSGSVAEDHLDSLTVNGANVTVASDGSFAMEIVGTEGTNTVAIVAEDMAGNTTAVSRTVMIDSLAPVLSSMLPRTNTTLYTGDRVTIAFDSEPGLAEATFQIGISGASTTGTVDPATGVAKPGVTVPGKTPGSTTPGTATPGEVTLTEVRPGHYEAEWTVPDGISSNAAYVMFRAVDAAGNETRAVAAGTLRIIDNTRPVAVIKGPASGRVNTLMTFDGRSSTDADGRIVSWVWNWGDGTAESSGNRVPHRYTRTGTYTVTLTVTDDKGATATATHTVTVTR